MTHCFKWRMTDISDAVGCICISQNKFNINTCTNCQLHISGAVLCWRWISLSICNFKKHICHNIVLLLILIMWLDSISFLRTYFLHFLCLLLTKIVSLVICHKFILLHCGFSAFVLNEWCLVPCFSALWTFNTHPVYWCHSGDLFKHLFLKTSTSWAAVVPLCL